MNIFLTLYNEALFRPLFNLLVGITNTLPGHNVGLAIILVTLIIRLVLLPSSWHQIRQLQKNQEKTSHLKEKLAAINKQYKDDPAKKAEATLKLYREAGLNPLGGCLPLLIQFPVLIALYRVFLVGLGPDTWQYLYSFVTRPEIFHLFFLGIDLTSPSLLFGVLAGAAQFAQMRFFAPAKPLSPPSSNEDSAKMMESMQKNMTYIFPVMTIFISLSLPAALSLYWLTTTLFALLQSYLIKKITHTTLPIPIT
jgi:YidC/Oxa1 family membrane protein insertase